MIITPTLQVSYKLELLARLIILRGFSKPIIQNIKLYPSQLWGSKIEVKKATEKLTKKIVYFYQA